MHAKLVEDEKVAVGEQKASELHLKQRIALVPQLDLLALDIDRHDVERVRDLRVVAYHQRWAAARIFHRVGTAL